MALRVWLPLNGTLDNKGISNVTVTNNGATVDNNGKIGKCYYFNGSSWIKITVPSSLKSIKNSSVCAWVKSMSSVMALGGISNDTSYADAQMTLYTSGWQFGGSSSYRYISNGTVANTQVWHHVCCTCNDTTITTYLDGVKVTSKTLTDLGVAVTELNSNNFIEIGCDHPGGNEYLTGYVNDFRIYDHCLSVKEIKEISQGLILHYKLDGGYQYVIPSEYQQVEYLESSGTQYINTGYIANTYPLQLNAKMSWVSAPSSEKDFWGNFNATTQSSSSYCFVCGGRSTNKWYQWGGSVWDIPSLTTNIIYDTSFTYTGTTGREARIDNTISSNSISNNNALTTTDGYIGLFSGAGKRAYCCGSFRIYSASIVHENITVRNFIPCYRISDNVAGMYDLITETFFINNGSGFFIVGPNMNISTVKDSSGYERDGTVTGSLQIINENGGRYNTHTYFTDYTCGISYNLGGFTPTAITMSCWIKSSNKNPRGSHHLPLNISSTNFEISVANSGQARIGYVVGGTRYVSNVGPDILDGKWHMITSTFNGSTICRYVDGILINSEARTGALTAANTVGVGVFPGGTSYGNTQMSESDVRIYATALSAEDILELYHTSASIDNLGKLHTFSLEENNKHTSIQKNGIFKTSLFDSILQLPDGSEWFQICSHDVKKGTNLFNSSDDFSKLVYHNESCWSNFGAIDTITRYDTNYEFLVLQQTNGSEEFTQYRWAQTKSPLSATWDDVKPSSSNITHYDGVTAYGGMYKMASTVWMCFANGSNGNWYGCAHKQLWGGTAGTTGYIPGYNGVQVSQWQNVYIRIKNNVYKQSNNISFATDFIEK